MWRRFLERKEFKVRTSELSTIHKFLGTSNEYDTQKIEQNDSWFKKTLDSQWFSNWNHVIIQEALNMQNEIEASRLSMANAFSESDSLRSKVRILENEIVQIQSSKSWRFTEPLRKFQETLKGKLDCS